MEHQRQIEYMSTLFAIERYFGHDEDTSFTYKSDLARPINLEGLGNDALKKITQLQSMDWLSNMFVRKPLGDVVAAITQAKKDRKEIVFHISNNNSDHIDKDDNNCATSLIRRINTVKGLNLSLESNILVGIKEFLHHIMEFGWLRIHRKFLFVRDAVGPDGPKAGVTAQFSLLLDKIHNLGHFVSDDFNLDDNNTETTEQKITRGVVQTKDTFNSLINLISIINKKHSDSITEDIDRRIPYTTEEKLKDYEKVADYCVFALSVIDSVMTRTWPLFGAQPGESEEDSKKRLQWNKFASRIHNRLTRILKYKAGARLFLSKSLSDFRTHCKSETISDITFSIQWVNSYTLAESLPKITDTVKYSEAQYIAWLKPFMARFGVKESSKSYKLLHHRISQAFGFKPIISFNPSLHCEIAMMHYCDVRKIKPLYGVIGVSKLNCWSCSAYKLKYAEGERTQAGLPRESRYTMTGYSGKAHHNWYIPTSLNFRGAKATKASIEGKDKAVMSVIRKAQSKLLEILSESNDEDPTVGSDSSSGSITNRLLQQFVLQK